LRFIRFALVLALAALLHFLAARLDLPGASAVNLFLVILVREALQGNTLWGLFAGVVVGAVEDTFSGRLYGLHGCADTLVGYGTALIAQRVVIERTGGVMLTYLGAAVAQQILLLVLVLLILPRGGAPEIPWILARAGVVAVLGGVVHVLTRQWRKRYEGWRHHRGSRLRFGR
jgi:rod shape-determining protein MreD